MRSIVIFILAITLQTQTMAQNDSLKQVYIQKSKNLKAGAWILGVVGTTLLVVAAAGTQGPTDGLQPVAGENNSDANGRQFLLYSGIACIAGSAALFICAGKNKRKASIAMNTSSSYRLQTNGIARVIQPGVRLSISL